MSEILKLYKLVSCTNEIITVQTRFKAAILNLTWEELLIPEYLTEFEKEQLFFLGAYCSHNRRFMKSAPPKFNHDPEITSIEKLILSEVRGGVYLLMDVKTKKLETLSINFILSNFNLLNSFTAMQTFFIGMRAGILYDANKLYC